MAATRTLDIFYEHTKYQVKADVCPTWLFAVKSVLAARREGDDPSKIKVKTLNGKVLDHDASTQDEPWQGPFFFEHADRPEVRFG